MEVFVTGLGVVSAAGIGLAENLDALRQEKSGIRRSDERRVMLGEVALSNAQLIDQLHLPEKDYSRTTLLGMLAAQESWGTNHVHPAIRTGLISATSAGGMDRMEHYYAQLQHRRDPEIFAKLVFDNGGTTEGIASLLGISGYIGTISTACSSGANAIMHGARLIEAGRLDRVLVGGTDPITDFNIKGFSALSVYDQERCRPFDQSRNGLNLGEGAAFLVLENESSLAKTGHTPICRLSGWNNASDAFHQTASSDDGRGASLAMNHALTKAGLTAADVAYVNAHGTGTTNNDLSESMALSNVFGNALPPFSSTKAFTGHTLAAAGAIEAVYCVLAVQLGAIFPNLNFSAPMPETGFLPATRYRSGEKVEHALSNSFGFGGNCTSLILSKAS